MNQNKHPHWDQYCGGMHGIQHMLLWGKQPKKELTVPVGDQGFHVVHSHFLCALGMNVTMDEILLYPIIACTEAGEFLLGLHWINLVRIEGEII